MCRKSRHGPRHSDCRSVSLSREESTVGQLPAPWSLALGLLVLITTLRPLTLKEKQVL